MNIVIINGQNHKGSTNSIANNLAQKVGGEITEFFLPRDFNKTCTGCLTCVSKDEKLCPHYKDLTPIINAVDKADLIILASPVYVFHVTGQMKTLLDHFAYRWLVHRPEKSMFKKQAVCISTAAGGGTKSTNKDMADSLFYWGIPKIYKFGFNIMAESLDAVPQKRKDKLENDLTSMAKKINKNYNKVKPKIKLKVVYAVMNKMHHKEWGEVDKKYWQNQGWTLKNTPWAN